MGILALKSCMQKDCEKCNKENKIIIIIIIIIIVNFIVVVVIIIRATVHIFHVRLKRINSDIFRDNIEGKI